MVASSRRLPWPARDWGACGATRTKTNALLACNDNVGYRHSDYRIVRLRWHSHRRDFSPATQVRPVHQLAAHRSRHGRVLVSSLRHVKGLLTLYILCGELREDADDMPAGSAAAREVDGTPRGGTAAAAAGVAGQTRGAAAVPPAAQTVDETRAAREALDLIVLDVFEQSDTVLV